MTRWSSTPPWRTSAPRKVRSQMHWWGNSTRRRTVWMCWTWWLSGKRPLPDEKRFGECLLMFYWLLMGFPRPTSKWNHVPNMPNPSTSYPSSGIFDSECLLPQSPQTKLVGAFIYFFLTPFGKDDVSQLSNNSYFWEKTRNRQLAHFSASKATGYRRSPAALTWRASPAPRRRATATAAVRGSSESQAARRAAKELVKVAPWWVQK